MKNDLTSLVNVIVCLFLAVLSVGQSWAADDKSELYVSAPSSLAESELPKNMKSQRVLTGSGILVPAKGGTIEIATHIGNEFDFDGRNRTICGNGHIIISVDKDVLYHVYDMHYARPDVVFKNVVISLTTLSYTTTTVEVRIYPNSLETDKITPSVEGKKVYTISLTEAGKVIEFSHFGQPTSTELCG